MTRRKDPQRAAIEASLVDGTPEALADQCGRWAKDVVALVHTTMPNAYPELTRNGLPCLPLRLTPAVPWEASLGNMLKREFRDDASSGQGVLNPDLVAAIIVDALVKARRPIRLSKDWFAGAVSRALAPAPKPRPVTLYDGARGNGRGTFVVWLGTSGFKPTSESAPIDMSDEQPIAWHDEEDPDVGDELDGYDFEEYDRD